MVGVFVRRALEKVVEQEQDGVGEGE